MLEPKTCFTWSICNSNNFNDWFHQPKLIVMHCVHKISTNYFFFYRNITNLNFIDQRLLTNLQLLSIGDFIKRLSFCGAIFVKKNFDLSVALIKVMLMRV